MLSGKKVISKLQREEMQSKLQRYIHSNHRDLEYDPSSFDYDIELALWTNSAVLDTIIENAMFGFFKVEIYVLVTGKKNSFELSVMKSKIDTPDRLFDIERSLVRDRNLRELLLKYRNMKEKQGYEFGTSLGVSEGIFCEYHFPEYVSSVSKSMKEKKSKCKLVSRIRSPIIYTEGEKSVFE